jgi:hypothetical protein
MVEFLKNKLFKKFNATLLPQSKSRISTMQPLALFANTKLKNRLKSLRKFLQVKNSKKNSKNSPYFVKILLSKYRLSHNSVL